MNISGASFYDALNKFVTGAIICWFFMFVFGDCLCCFRRCLPQWYDCDSEFFSIILYWLVGVVFWVFSLMIQNPLGRIMPKFQTNYPGYVEKATEEVKRNEKINGDTRADKNKLADLKSSDYLSYYYDVMSRNMLGNVPVLEGFSAFSKNMCILNVIFIILLLIKMLCHCPQICQLGSCGFCIGAMNWIVIILLGILTVLFFFLYQHLEINIKRMIIETYVFIK